MAQRIVDVLVPVALDQAYSYRVPAGARARAGRHRRGAARRARGDRRGVGRERRRSARPAQPAQGRRGRSSTIRRSSRSCASSSTGSPNYTLAPRGMVLRMALRMGETRPRARARRRAARRPAAAAHDAGAPRVLRAARRRPAARPRARPRSEAGVSAGVIDGLVDEGTLETLVLPPEPVARQPDPDYRAPEFTDGAARGGRRAARDASRKGGFSVDAARRRHRLGQDRGLFRGGRRDDPAAAGRR